MSRPMGTIQSSSLCKWSLRQGWWQGRGITGGGGRSGWEIQGSKEVWQHQRATHGFPLPCFLLPCLPAGPVTEFPGPTGSRPQREARALTWVQHSGKDEGWCLLLFSRYSVHTAGWHACSLLPSTRLRASVRQWRCLVHYGGPSIQPSTWHTVST